MKTIFSRLKSVLGPNITKKVRPLGHGLKSILANVRYGFPSKNLTLIGINGTKGKTSTTIFTAKLLNQTGVKTGYISTALIYDGEKEFLNPYKMGTIDSWKMNELINKMKVNGCQVVVLEMTSEGLDQNRHVGLKKFDTALFLNAFPEHIEAHGGWENYLKAKSKLFSHTKKEAKVFINGDSKQVENFNQIAENVGTSLSDSWNLEKVMEGTDFEIIKNDDIYLSIKIAGTIYPTKLVANFEVLDLFFAWKVASLYSKKLLDSKVISPIFAEIGNLPGRMEWIYKNGVQTYISDLNGANLEDARPSKKALDLDNISIIVDYAHEPESLKLVLDTFINWKEQNRFDYIIHVLSCDGVGRDDWKKPILGNISYEKADFTVLTTDNYGPKDDPNKIVEMLAKDYNKVLRGAKYDLNIDRFEAFKIALVQARMQAAKGKKVLVFSTGVGTEFGLTNPSGILTWDERQKWIEAAN